MAERSIRSKTKRRLQDLLEAKPDLFGVQILRGWDEQAPEREHIRIGDASGTLSIPVMTAGRKHRDDRYTISLYVFAGVPGRGAEEAEERLEELVHVIGDVLADDHTLGELDGLVSAEMGEYAGPKSDPTPEGSYGYATPVEINCHARLT